MCNEHDVKMLRTLKKVFMEEKEKVVEQLLRIEVLEDIDPDKKLDMICEINNHFAGMVAIMQGMQQETRSLLILPSDLQLKPDYSRVFAEKAVAMGKNDGGSAYPLAPVTDPETGQFCGPHSEGMSLRDWFAGMALQGLLSFPDSRPEYYHGYAESAYKYADAMIEARDKEVGNG